MTHCLNPDCPKPGNSEHHRFCQNCGWRLRLGDRYEAVYPLGSGQNSRTFVGRDRTTLVHPQCLIKRFTPAGDTRLEREAAIERLRRDVEHWAIASQHPQIPGLLEYFERESHQFLVQQFLVGPHLDQRLQEKAGPFDSDEVTAFLQDVLPILHHLHQNHIIHRDIKPSNFRCPSGQNHWWLVDLGAIKPLTATRLAQPGTLVGSADYASPEQLRGEATFASDLYSLGVVCLHLLTGLQPFDLFDGVNSCWHWRSIVPEVSSSLAMLLDGMVQPALRDRTPNVETAMRCLGLTLPAVPTPPPRSSPTVPWQAEQTVELAQPIVAATPLLRANSLLVLTATGKVEGRSLTQPATLTHTFQSQHPYPSAIAAHPTQSVGIVATRQGWVESWSLRADHADHWDPQPLTRVDGGVTNLLFTPEGEWLLVADDRGRIHLWDWSAQRLKATWQGHGASVASLALNRSGSLLASGDTQGHVQLWQLRSGERLRTLSRQPGAITALAWLVDDRALVTAGWDVTLRWRCPNTGRVLQSAQAQGFYLPVRSLLAHPDESLLITGSQDGQLQGWDLVTQSYGMTGPVGAIATAPPAQAAIVTLSAIPATSNTPAALLSVTASGQLQRWSYPVRGRFV